MTPEQLKASILQYAIQGKLVEQRPEEGTAEEYFQYIQEERKKQLTRKEKPLPEITEDEVPFEIPNSWKWCRLREVCTKIVDGDHNPPAGTKSPTEYLMLSATNINNDSIVELDKVRYLTEDIFNVENQRTQIEINDIFFTIVGSMGRSCVYKGGYNICFQRSVSVITTLISPEYLKRVLDSSYIQTFMYKKATGTAQKGFYLNQVENLVIALPPYEEQIRIVEKIEELIPFVDRYAKAYEKLELFNAKFPEEMKKSILQYAIQGKLVEQRPEEGTAEDLYEQIQEEKQKLIKEGKIKKEKPLSEITEEEIPFDIPESWKWVKLGTVVSLLSGSDFPPSKYNDKGIGTPYMTGASNIEDEHLIINRWTETPNNISNKGDLLLVCKGSGYGKTVMNDVGTVHIARQFMAFQAGLPINYDYLNYFLQSQILKIKKSGQGVIPGIDRAFVLSMVMPLPPLEEQQRIVSKIEKLVPYCDRLSS